LKNGRFFQRTVDWCVVEAFLDKSVAGSTAFFDRFRVLKRKNRASGRLINRLKARFAYIGPIFAQNAKRNAFYRGRQKTFLLCERAP